MKEKKAGKLALITGGSSGIGMAISKQLLRKGYSTILVGRDEEKLQKAANHLKSLEDSAGLTDSAIQTVPCDLALEKECLRLHRIFQDNPVELLVNCAGFGVYGEFIETDPAKELSMLDVNCRAVHLLMKLFLQDMEKRGRGSILNVASSAGLAPGGPYMAAYYATKSYVTSLTRSAAEELRAAGSPIYVGVLCPGPVDTPFFDRAGIGAAVRGADPEKIAEAAICGMGKRKTVIVPGIGNRLACIASKLLPARPVLAVNRRIQAKKRQ